MPDLGLVTAALEGELTGELKRRGIVVWLDKDGTYTPYVDSLALRHAAGDFDAPVVAFRGSFLEVVLALGPFGSALDNQPLLLHLPGFNEETVRSTPVLELYEPGFRFRKALDTLIREVATGRVSPDDISAFIATPDLTLASADAWLASKLTDAREGLAGWLDGMTLEVVVLDVLTGRSLLAGRVKTSPDVETLLGWLNRQLGLDTAWLAFAAPGVSSPTLADLTPVVAAWILGVEYVHDLARPPFLEALKPLAALTKPLVERCRTLASTLRERAPERYVRLADEAELLFRKELSEGKPEDLGRIDTFREEEVRILAAALDAIRNGEWERTRTWAEARHRERSFWLSQDPARRSAWTLVSYAVDVGTALAAHPRPLAGVRSLEEAVEIYVRDAAAVDRAQRQFEQVRLRLLEPRLPHFGDFQEVVGKLRRDWREWADRLARDFSALCREHGFLPESTLQQRTIFEQVVTPLMSSGERTAVFLVDALRFEMATELADTFRASQQASAGTVDLKARLAELPTLTAVGMNALAPAATHGRLVPKLGTNGFQGFRTGEAAIISRDDRAKAMGQRTQGKPALLLELNYVAEADAATLKNQVAQSRLVVVTSRELDDAGEAGFGLQTFELTLRHLHSAWLQLRAAGVKQFVFTADHGFLLQDETVTVKPYGTKRDPSRRHVLADEARAEAGMLNVPLSALNYDGVDGQVLLFREDTAVFATGAAGATFVHGGNSPQERIIPVLVVHQRRAVAPNLEAYELETQAVEGLAGLHGVKIRGKVAPAQSGVLGFVAARSLSVAMRVPARPDIRPTIKGVRGGGQQGGTSLEIPVGETWCEVFFELAGPADERVQVELFNPGGVDCVKPALADAWFDVAGTLRASTVRPTGAPATDWQSGIADPGVTKVFAHLEQHGSITEAEITRMLGSPRAFRRFSIDFDGHVQRLPFKVRIESAPDGKRYVKEQER